MLQEAINAAFQVAVVLVIALVVWAIFERKRASFFRYIGLTVPTSRSMLWAFGVACVMVPLSIAVFMLPTLHDMAAGSNTVAGKLRVEGWSTDVAGQVAIIALIKTSFSEEILFRGLIAKRLIAWLGFGIGNMLHTAIFGAIHLLIFVVPRGSAFDPLIAGAFFVISGGGGWVMAWLNEKKGNGSIAPGWLLHALSNAIAYPVIAFF